MRLLKGIALLALLFNGCTSTGTPQHAHDQFTKHYEESLFKITGKGMFSVEMVVKEHALMTGVNSVDLIIHDKNDSDVVGAEISVTPWMPEMGHGVFEKPKVTERGGGLYSVENIILIMSGHWELRVNVKKGPEQDAAVFDFPDVKVDRGHDHSAVAATAPADIDLSTLKLSDKGVFKVSFAGSLDPIPLNRIHKWTVKVELPEGEPVTNAQIAIDGDMPEHGHGLPTQPEVTEELAGGEYIVDGMKFSMPGWWVIKFAITSNGKSDSVTFNLLLKE